MSDSLEVSGLLRERAREAPRRIALVEPEGRRGWRAVVFGGLDQAVDRHAQALARAGLRRGDRCLVFVRPGIEWASIVFGLFRLGAVPVLIDPAMGRAAVLASVERIRPRGFVGIAAASALKLAFARSFESVEVSLSVGRLGLGGATLASWMRDSDGEFDAEALGADDAAAVLFTSGSTGPAKGVAYTHGMFRAQVAALRELYDMRAGEIDLACFAPFALFGPALGLTTVLPRMDFSHPARCDPAEIARAIAEHRPVQTFGSPAIWRRVAPWCREHGVVLSSLRRLMIAGAPVPPALIADCLAVLDPGADVHTPYGATEALPVSSASGRELLASSEEDVRTGAGTCVGRAAPFVEARAIRIDDGAIETWRDDLEVGRGEPGELVVRGPQVTREYENDAQATRLAKIRDGDTLWHRMGDVVRIDPAERIWFLGRKSHRLETREGVLFPTPVEAWFEADPRVRRAALVGVGGHGSERPTLVVEPASPIPSSSAARDELCRELLRARSHSDLGRRVERVLLRESLPVDVRHNAKIDRPALKRWAEEQLG